MGSMSAVGADDAWAIFAFPPGQRDLGCGELWERSLARSRRRRNAAAVGRPRRMVPAALVVATLVGATGQVAAAQGVTATTTAGESGNLQRGSRGPAVAAVQRALGIPADGIFGPQTRRAVRAFQRAHGLAADGIVGPLTSAALRGGAGTTASGPSPLGPQATTALQRTLGITADGVYGPQTRAAVRAYQAAHGLEVDGVAGPQTLGALGLPAASAPAGAGTSAAVAAARSKIGAPYVWAGVGPTGFDCSGLTVWAMRQAGIALPRTSYDQSGVGSAVGSRAIQQGDLVFFDANGAGASHVGIATGPSTAISATTHGVREHAIFGPYWGAHYLGARRVG
jgi:cell wall-associated NlpC family hydrolase